MQPGESGGVEDRYGFVFVLLLLNYSLSAFITTFLGRLIALGLYLVTLVVALRAARFSRTTARGLLGAVVMAGVLVALLARATSVGAAHAHGLVASLTAVLTLMTLAIVVVRVLRHRVIKLQTIFGALSAYLLIGFMFTALYSATTNWSSAPFFLGGEAESSANLQYFSFVTLTTTGYGDLTAASASGRALAVMEALLGQIFLVTLVARLVSVFGTTREASLRPFQHADRHQDGSPNTGEPT